MPIATRSDVEIILGCPLTDAERSAFDLIAGGLTAEIEATVGPLGLTSDATLEFRPERSGSILHLPSPLNDVTSVLVDGSAVTVESWSTSGVVRLAACVEAGAEVVVTFDYGAAVPADVRARFAAKIAAVYRARRAAAAQSAANPAGVQSKTIGSTTVTFTAGTDMADWLATAGAGVASLSEDERRWYRRRMGRQTTSAAATR